MAPTLESLGIDRLSVAERIQLAEAIRESIPDGMSAATLVPVQTFAPEPYDLLQPLHVAVEPADGEFTASFLDANLTAYGHNEHEAVEHLKAMILDTFDKFSSGRRLGPGPARQLAVLRQFVRKRG